MGSYHPKKKRLLLVDDEATLRMVISEILSEAGYAVDIAESGKDALKKISGNNYNLVISDMNMPDMSGMAFYHSVIKNTPQLKKRFLFLTGGPTDAMLSFIEEANCKYLTKPVKMLELLSEIDAILNKDSAWTIAEEKRTEERFHWSMDCSVLENKAHLKTPFIARVEDASTHGAKIRYLGKPLAPATIVSLYIMNLNLQIPAKIMWSKISEANNLAGLRLTEPIPIPVTMNSGATP